ncbi:MULTISPECIES: hypothetical protein [Microbacterium]|uniref:hypothetical protein n=1 Tax=Microbacterium TaxID=33882 RepID=UPI00217CC88C|nr:MULTISPECIES: hypothetical protein [Microbacterium]
MPVVPRAALPVVLGDDRSARGQEALDRDRLVALIEEGVQSGDFRTDDPFAACVRIFIAIDGIGAYANNRNAFPEGSYVHFVADVAEWTLGLEPGVLRAEAAAVAG